VTWAQLGLHAKPIGILNVGGYFDPLLAWLNLAVKERFLKPVHRRLLLEAKEPQALLDLMQNYRPRRNVGKWLKESDL
jgi:predicted Rossmann-fold nucleotide-binding protein